jgi:glycine cleavage system H protein
VTAVTAVTAETAETAATAATAAAAVTAATAVTFAVSAATAAHPLRYHPTPSPRSIHVRIRPFEYSMSTPSDCRVSDTHEWFKVNGSTVTIGITQHAADQLTDITYVGMKSVGTAVAAGASVGEVESVKISSDIYTTSAGKIVAVNDEVAKDPSIVNSDPCGKGWLVKLEVSDTSAILALLDGPAYDKKHGH